MPASVVQTAADERHWEKAKQIVRKQYPELDEKSDRFWRLVMGVFKRMRGIAKTLVHVDGRGRLSKAVVQRPGSRGGHFRIDAHGGVRYDRERERRHRAIEGMAAPSMLREDPAGYFQLGQDHHLIPIDKLRPVRKRPGATEHAEKYMALAARGLLPKRLPIVVRPLDDGTYEIVDGNSTYHAARNHGWSHLPAIIEGQALNKATQLTLALDPEFEFKHPRGEGGRFRTKPTAPTQAPAAPEPPLQRFRQRFWIPQKRLDDVRAGIDRLNKRADRLGISPIEMTVGEAEMRRVVEDAEGNQRVLDLDEVLPDAHQEVGFVRMVPVDITADEPRSPKGWRYAATIEHLRSGNLVHASGEIPEHYRNAPPKCDHCATDRERRRTYVVVNDAGEHKQVGSDCIADFTGVKDPRWYSAMVDLIGDARALMEHASEQPREVRGGYIDLVHFLAWAAKAIREQGFVSRAMAQEKNKVSTAVTVIDWLTSPAFEEWRKDPENQPSAEDVALARKTVEWVQQLHERMNSDDPAARELRGNDFLWNLATLGRENEIHLRRHAGFAAAMIPAYQRAAAAAVGGEHIGRVGQRIEFDNLRLRRVVPINTDFGTTVFHEFHDPAGNTIVWFATDRRLRPKVKYRGRATIKRHDVRGGVKRTHITRFDAEPIEELDNPEFVHQAWMDAWNRYARAVYTLRHADTLLEDPDPKVVRAHKRAIEEAKRDLPRLAEEALRFEPPAKREENRERVYAELRELGFTPLEKSWLARVAEFLKTHVRAYTRRSPTGKLVQVKEHEDRRRAAVEPGPTPERERSEAKRSQGLALTLHQGQGRAIRARMEPHPSRPGVWRLNLGESERVETCPPNCAPVDIERVCEGAGGCLDDPELGVRVPKNIGQIKRKWNAARQAIQKELVGVASLGRPPSYKNGARTVAQLYEDAKAVEPALRAMVTGVAAMVGGTVNFGPINPATGTDYAIKSEHSMREKIKRIMEREGVSEDVAVQHVSDPVRGSIIVDTPKQLREAVQHLRAYARAHGARLYVDNKFANAEGLEAGGYAAVHCDLELVNPKTKRAVRGEIQLHLTALHNGRPDSIKERAHTLYEIAQGREGTPQGKTIKDRARAASVLLYTTALARYLGGLT